MLQSKELFFADPDFTRNKVLGNSQFIPSKLLAEPLKNKKSLEYIDIIEKKASYHVERVLVAHKCLQDFWLPLAARMLSEQELKLIVENTNNVNVLLKKLERRLTPDFNTLVAEGLLCPNIAK